MIVQLYIDREYFEQFEFTGDQLVMVSGVERGDLISYWADDNTEIVRIVLFKIIDVANDHLEIYLGDIKEDF